VQDAANGEDGTVDFASWIAMSVGEELPAPAGALAAPAAAQGGLTAIRFRFSDATDNFLLGDGPGDLNGPPPFQISTDNGTLTTESGEGEAVGGFLDDGFLNASLVPEDIGEANIDADGPCGLAAGLGLEVEQGVAHGDVDCDGDVDSVDALKLLQYLAGLDPQQTPPCTPIGDAFGDGIFGDVDCDGDVDSVDALKVLQHIAGLPANLPPGCGPFPE
jgi:hypothetical protein